MDKRTPRLMRQQAGFSLIEVMIAVVIGMIAMLVVMQIFGTSESKKRITTGGNDAHMGGVLAMNTIQRDVRQAGYGITAMPLLGCDITGLGSGATLKGLAPVTINHPSIPKGDDYTDTVLVAYGVANGAPEGDVVTSQPDGDKSYAVATPTVFAKDDWVIAEPSSRPATCTLALDQVASVPTTGTTLTVKTGTASMSFGTLYNLGHDNADSTRGPQFLAYRVFKGNLTVCNYMVNDCGSDAKKEDATVWTPIAANIVSLKAQYGRDTSKVMDGVVDQFDNATPDVTKATYVCDIARIPAVRLALVARSSDYDKKAPTLTAPTWDGSVADNPKDSTANPIDLSGKAGLPSGVDWTNYRYKVFQTVVPIRTTTWMEPIKECNLP